MRQVVWRADDELVARVQSAARRQGHSMNRYLTLVLDAATNPDRASTDLERVVERLFRAGLLAPSGTPRERPDRRQVARARRAAGAGTPAAHLVSEGRG